MSRLLSVPPPSRPAMTAIMRGNPSHDTKPEKAIRSQLHRRGLRFRKNYSTRAGDLRVRIDIVFTKRKLAVFIDGCFWHQCPQHGTVPRSNVDYWAPKLARNVARDAEVSAALESDGWTVLRFWEHAPDEDVVDAIIHTVSG